VRHKNTTAAAVTGTGTAATLPNTAPASGEHHTGIGAGISNLLHPHGGGAQARGPTLRPSFGCARASFSEAAFCATSCTA
jgi:hypothetical protein